MKTFVLKSMLLIFLFTLYVFATEPIVCIGGRNYTKDELLLRLRTTNQDPMEAINQIKRDQLMELLAKSKNMHMEDPEKALYKNLFGTSLEDDTIIDNDPVLPLAAKKEVRLKKLVFERKIAQMAEEEVPVSFIDANGFWELVKNCKSYQIRKQHGVETPMENWEYTWNELYIEPEMVVATKKGDNFLTGSELNLWIKENYSHTIRAYVKRKFSKNEILDVCAKRAVQGKLAAGKIGDRKLSIKNEFIERTVDDYINNNMMTSDFSVRDLKGKTYNDVHQMIKEKYSEKSTAQLNKISNILKGKEKLLRIDSKETVYCTNAAVGSMQMDIANSIADSEIYDWIKANKFKGSFKEAHLIVSNEKYEIVIEKDIAQDGIAINSFK